MMQSFSGHAGDVMSLDLSPAESGATFASGVRALFFACYNNTLGHNDVPNLRSRMKVCT